MNALLLAGGAVLLLLGLADVVATTLAVGTGGGPLTRRLLGRTWRGLLRLHRRGRGSRWLSWAGPGLLLMTALVWVGLLWGGWSLVFLASSGAVVDADTGAPAGVADVVYYAGFTVFTLGTGDVVAATPAWRITTAVASFTGLFSVTLAITYLVSVLSAVVARRALAVQVHALGEDAAGVLVQGWTGRDFSQAFVQQLVSLGGALASVAEQHLAYPVLHYWHSRDRGASAPLALAQLDDALLLLRGAVAENARPGESAVVALRRSLGRYVLAAGAVSAVPETDRRPPVPDPGPLAAAGIPLADRAALARLAAEEAAHRGALARLVHGDGRTWPRTRDQPSAR
ncbi:potassium channel family protein [Geodermatophilus sp. SYSU D00758]